MNYYEKHLEAAKNGRTVERRLISSTGEEAVFQDGKLVASTSGRTDFSGADYADKLRPLPHLFLFGAGHVGKALYDVAMLQDFPVTILDERPEQLSEERFPKAKRFIAPYPELLKREYDVLAPYYVIFTHDNDRPCLEYCLRHQHSYVGMIGSKAKVKATFAAMPKDLDLSNVHSPIGLSINAVTPAEIAISIMAEIISVFREDRKTLAEDLDMLSIFAKKSGMLVRIIETEGSGPGKRGAEMLVTDAESIGTIGGGALEKNAIDTARKMLAEGDDYLLKDYDLTPKGELGMLCGGRERVLFRAIRP